MKQITIHPLTKKLNTEISIPGCIGYTIRALNLAAVTKGSVRIMNPLKSDDTSTMINILNTLGIRIEEGENYITVHGDISDIKDMTYEINVGLSGRTARSILALLCVVKGTKTVICGEDFKKRPVGDLVEGLRKLGASIVYTEKEGYLPLKILSSRLAPGTISMNGSISSQYFSALMMIAPVIGEVVINVEGNQSSKPYIDMTINILKKFGIIVTNNNYTQYIINGNQSFKNPNEYLVEPEATSASYFFALAALTNSKIRILGLSPQSLQGDIRFVDILEKMGCSVIKNNTEKWIEVEGPENLNGITVDMNDSPDLVPTLSVIAAFAQGQTVINNIAHAKFKESDRIESPKIELQKMGVECESTNNSLTIQGGAPKGTTIDTYGDHRMAMAFAIAGTKIEGITINNPDVVNKSFPDFWDKLESIGVRTERSNLL